MAEREQEGFTAGIVVGWIMGAAATLLLIAYLLSLGVALTVGLG